MAIFVTKAPIPFVNKAPRASDRILEPKSGAELPDPNKTMQAKAGKPAQAEVPAASAPTSPDEDKKDDRKDSILGLLGTIGGAVGGAGAGTNTAPSSPNPPPVVTNTPTAPAPIVAAKPSYLLQVGSFVSNADADGRKVKLALAGFEARVTSAEVDGKTVYRVRTGPYKDFDEMNKARARLTESGFDVSIARQ